MSAFASICVASRSTRSFDVEHIDDDIKTVSRSGRKQQRAHAQLRSIVLRWHPRFLMLDISDHGHMVQLGTVSCRTIAASNAAAHCSQGAKQQMMKYWPDTCRMCALRFNPPPPPFCGRSAGRESETRDRGVYGLEAYKVLLHACLDIHTRKKGVHDVLSTICCYYSDLWGGVIRPSPTSARLSFLPILLPRFRKRLPECACVCVRINKWGHTITHRYIAGNFD